MAEFAWQILFWIIRYGLVALLLAYLTYVFVKKKDVQTNTKGYVLEWRVEAYKKIHQWVMGLHGVIAAPSQDEDRYQGLLSSLKFKIGYQGMEYAAIFDSPESLLKFGMDFNSMFNQEGDLIDYRLEHQLNSFQMWLDDVRMFLFTFIKTEADKQWKQDEDTAEKNCNLGCKVMGIALQEDINRYFEKIDGVLRDRLRGLKISNVYKDSLRDRLVRKVTDYCEKIMDEEGEGLYSKMMEWLYFNVIYRSYGCSQLQKHQLDIYAIFAKVHFQEQLSEEDTKSKDELLKQMTDYQNCFIKHFIEYDENRRNAQSAA